MNSTEVNHNASRPGEWTHTRWQRVQPAVGASYAAIGWLKSASRNRGQARKRGDAGPVHLRRSRQGEQCLLVPVRCARTHGIGRRTICAAGAGHGGEPCRRTRLPVHRRSPHCPSVSARQITSVSSESFPPTRAAGCLRPKWAFPRTRLAQSIRYSRLLARVVGFAKNRSSGRKARRYRLRRSLLDVV